MDAVHLGEILKAKLGAQSVEVVDESPLHAGHEGARSGGGHYKVTIVSDAFDSKTPMERHRMVYRALESEMGLEIHALALETRTPGERRQPKFRTQPQIED